MGVRGGKNELYTDEQKTHIAKKLRNRAAPVSARDAHMQSVLSIVMCSQAAD